jgi:glycosyltransferase involved in cell wall biosynthesis
MTEIKNANQVSIVLPIYNVEKYLARCLDSILNQTFTDFEVICVNDGSPDNSLEILEKYKKIDNRIKIISQENKGLSGARNTGIKHSNGEYIAFIDSDDVIHPKYLEVFTNFIGDADFISSKHIRIEDHNDLNFHEIELDKINVETVNNVRHNYLINKVYKHTQSVVWNKLFKKSSLGDITFEEGISPGEDDIFTFKFMMEAQKIVLINAELYYYMANETSTMTTLNYNSSKVKKSSLAFAQAISTYTKNNKSSLSKKEISKLEKKQQSILFKAYLKKQKNKDDIVIAIKELNNCELFNYKKLKFNQKLKYIYMNRNK